MEAFIQNTEEDGDHDNVNATNKIDKIINVDNKDT